MARWAATQRQLLPLPTRYRRQQSPDVKPQLSTTCRPLPWSARKASWLVVKKHETLGPDEKDALDRLQQVSQQVAQIAKLARQFVEMLRNGREENLIEWIEETAATGVRAFVSFAKRLVQDLASVRHALQYLYSNGQVEGQVNRLKSLRRQMFGRANFDLFRKRVLVASIPL